MVKKYFYMEKDTIIILPVCNMACLMLKRWNASILGCSVVSRTPLKKHFYSLFLYCNSVYDYEHI